jgi:cytochrome b561
MEQSMPRYQWSIILTHWILSALIIAALAVGWYGSRVAPESAGWIGAFNLHISLGITSAIFAILLLILRLVHKAPPYSSQISSLQAVFARSLHWLLYIYRSSHCPCCCCFLRDRAVL